MYDTVIHKFFRHTSLPSNTLKRISITFTFPLSTPNAPIQWTRAPYSPTVADEGCLRANSSDEGEVEPTEIAVRQRPRSEKLVDSGNLLSDDPLDHLPRTATRDHVGNVISSNVYEGESTGLATMLHRDVPRRDDRVRYHLQVVTLAVGQDPPLSRGDASGLQQAVGSPGRRSRGWRCG